jgi:hypothetical protein
MFQEIRITVNIHQLMSDFVQRELLQRCHTFFASIGPRTSHHVWWQRVSISQVSFHMLVQHAPHTMPSVPAAEAMVPTIGPRASSHERGPQVYHAPDIEVSILFRNMPLPHIAAPLPSAAYELFRKYVRPDISGHAWRWDSPVHLTYTVGYASQ